MRTFFHLFISLFLLAFVTGACKKKTTSDAILPAMPCRLLSNVSYSSSSVSTNTFTYDSNGFVASGNYSNKNKGGTTATIRAYTRIYLFDSTGRIIQATESPGNRNVYEYTSGKLSRYTVYIADTVYSYTNYEYTPGKMLVKEYWRMNGADVIVSSSDYTLSGENIIGENSTQYHPYGHYISSIQQAEYSGFDDKYSANYIIGKSYPEIGAIVSKNNNRSATYTDTEYYLDGSQSPTDVTHSSSTFLYNRSGATVEAVITNATSNSYNATIDTRTYTEKYTYTNCY